MQKTGSVSRNCVLCADSETKPLLPWRKCCDVAATRTVARWESSFDLAGPIGQVNAVDIVGHGSSGSPSPRIAKVSD